jgi:serine/threonine protein kinase
MMEKNPDCRIDNLKQIIDKHNSWALNSSEFDINEAFSKMLKSGPIDKSYVYQMCRKYLLNSFEDKFIRNNWYKTEYEEEKYLGEGKFGQVFKVRNIWNNNLFAIKKIKLLKEISTEALKNDINSFTINEYDNDMILQYFEFWIENDFMNTTTLFIRMELCDMSLSEFNKELEKYPELKDISLTPMGYFLVSLISLDLITNINYLHSLRKHAYFAFRHENILLKINENSNNFVRLGDVDIKYIYKYAQPLSSNRKDVNISEYLTKKYSKVHLTREHIEVRNVFLIFCT